MSRWGWLRRRRMAHRDQGGYILGTVLAAMTVGLLLITALLGLSFTTHTAAITQQQLARERRAADGAMETAVAGIRAVAGAAADPCTGVASPVAMEVDGGAESPVALTCSSILDPDPNVTGGVTILGDRAYAGQAADGTAWAGWFPSPAPSVALVHKGAQPLQFVGNVSVKTGGAVVGPAAGPGARVSGRYVQGDGGAGGSGPTDCGPLAATGPRQVVTSIGSPECGDAGAKGITADSSTIVAPGISPSAAGIPATCGAGTVTFQPGRFDATATGRLNALFSQTCTATYQFAPGTYWFDGAVGSNSLVFDNPNARFVFGEAVAGGCNPASSSTTQVVLSASTRLEHRRGDLSICAGATSTGPVMVQAAESGTNPVLSAVNPLGAPYGLVDNPGLLTTRVGDLGGALGAGLQVGSTTNGAGFRADIVDNGSRPLTSLRFRWVSQEEPWQATYGDPLRQVMATLIDRSTNVQVCTTGYVDSGRGALWGSAPASRNWVGSEVDLFAATGTCAGLLQGRPQSELNKYRIDVRWRYGNLPSCVGCVLYVSDSHLVVNSATLDTAAATSSDGSWTSPANVIAKDGAAASADSACVPYVFGIWTFPTVCQRPDITSAPARMFRLQLDSASLPTGLQAGDHISSLVLALDVSAGDDGRSYPDSPKPGLTQATLDGTGCTASAGGYWRSKQTYYLDFGDCVQNADQLRGASITVEMRWEIGSYFGSAPIPDASLKLPDLDFARMVATTDTVHESQRSVIRVDETAGSSSFSRVRVYGDVKMPRMNLDVLWSGGAATQSLFNGALTLNALVSTDGGVAGRSVGVVCCGPVNPTVRLKAYTDNDTSGVVRGAATVRLEPGAVAGTTDAVVTDWQLCALDGCHLDDVAAGPAP